MHQAINSNLVRVNFEGGVLKLPEELRPYFKLNPDGKSAACLKCVPGPKVLQINRSWKGLQYHASNVHGAKLSGKTDHGESAGTDQNNGQGKVGKKRQSNENEKDIDVLVVSTGKEGLPGKKRVKGERLTEYFLSAKDLSLMAVIARMVALDGLPYLVRRTGSFQLVIYFHRS